MKSRIASILVLLSAAFMIVMSWLSSTGALGGRTMQDVALVPGQILVPATRTFGIRGVIYLGLVIFSIYQLGKHSHSQLVIQELRPWVIMNFLANGLWLPAATMRGWHRSTVVLILVMWVSLLYITIRLKIAVKTKGLTLYATIPMSLYFAWVTIATPLNIASFLHEIGFTVAMTSIGRTLLWIGIGYIVNLIVFWKFRYLTTTLVTIWALIGVLAVRIYDAPSIAWAAGILLFITIIAVITRIGQKKLLRQ